jgi:hypothetical protein
VLITHQQCLCLLPARPLASTAYPRNSRVNPESAPTLIRHDDAATSAAVAWNLFSLGSDAPSAVVATEFTDLISSQWAFLLDALNGIPHR